MLYSAAEKRKIIFSNYSQPSHQTELEKLKKKSEEWQISFATFRSLEQGCGDIIHLLIKKKDNHFEKCLFSGQQSCLITVAVANILCSCLEGKDLNFARELLNNCQAMIEKKNYNLDNCPNLQAFSDISQFPHRVECLKLVIRGLIELIN